MKFLPLRELSVVTSALNFDTPDCHVTGSCDLYTTKAAGSDKKLYKSIDKSLEISQLREAAILKLGASLSPPGPASHRQSQQRRKTGNANTSVSTSLPSSRIGGDFYSIYNDSPFGPLTEISSRRTYAYLIATLNASHPDYDFSHTLRPADFSREDDLRAAISAVDSTLTNVRASVLNGSIPRSYGDSIFYYPSTSPTLVSTSAPGSSKAVTSKLTAAKPASSSDAPAGEARAQDELDLELDLDLTPPTWGPHMWAKIDKEMDLKNCQVYCYSPADDPFEEDEPAAVWSLHYFFFNKQLKRVVYLYARCVPVLSHSPDLRPRRTAMERVTPVAGVGGSGAGGSGGGSGVGGSLGVRKAAAAGAGRVRRGSSGMSTGAGTGAGVRKGSFGSRSRSRVSSLSPSASGLGGAGNGSTEGGISALRRRELASDFDTYQYQYQYQSPYQYPYRQYRYASSAAKRARFWLGDRVVESTADVDDDDVDDDEEDQGYGFADGEGDGAGAGGLVWNRDDDGEVENPNDDVFEDEDEEEEEEETDLESMDEDVEVVDEDDGRVGRSSGGAGAVGFKPVRGVSEDIAGRMELD